MAKNPKIINNFISKNELISALGVKDIGFGHFGIFITPANIKIKDIRNISSIKESFKKVIDYLERDERRHYEEYYFEEIENVDIIGFDANKISTNKLHKEHIYTHIRILKDFLNKNEK